MATWIVEGRRSKNIWQHPIAAQRGKEAMYVDPDIGGQLVAYVSGEKPPENAWIRFTGKPLEFETQSKRPGDTRKFPVKQLDVERWEPIPQADLAQSFVDKMGSDAPIEEKRVAKQELYKVGRDAFPVCIAHLEDERVYERCDVQNYLGLPPEHVAPRPKPIIVDVKVGSEMRDTLQSLLTPIGYRSPYERNFKPHSMEMFLVKDWRAFWQKRRTKTLAQIHEELKPLVDRYYQTGGDAQPVE